MSPEELERLYIEATAFYRNGDLQQAGRLFERILQQASNIAPAHNGLGLCLYGAGNQAAALQSFETAIRFDPFFASAHINRGMVLRDMGRHDAALASLEKAVALDPHNPNAHSNRGMVLTELQQPAAANACFDRCLQLAPDFPDVAGIRLLNKVHVCDWVNLEPEIAALLDAVKRGVQATPPWPLLALTDDAALKRQVMERWMRTICPEVPALGPLKTYTGHQRIKLGYFSADYHRHATAHLIAELFERHDRAKFEVIAFSFGDDTGDDMQQRIAAGCTRYLDVRARSDRDIAALARTLEIDIAIDLKGFTLQNRIGIFAHRAAPVQVNYLGFPGTMGTPYMDYIIADGVVIPESHKRFYTEKVVNLPGSYQCNDRKRAVSKRAYTRAEAGLPETGIVFCCFNNNFKILPGIFARWARIMNAVPGSVLWLIEDNPQAAANLKRNAPAFGLDPARIVFAPRIPPDEHLARHKLADLFLDTLPYNAHTTASDSLWVGVPLVTCPGESFPARVAASLLTAVGLPELAAPTLEEYETLAIALAQDPTRLQALKDHLIATRATAPLFDTDAFTRDIEAAYTGMHEARAH